MLHNEQMPHHPGPAVAYAATVRSLIAAITAQASPSQGHHMTKGRRRIPVAPRSTQRTPRSDFHTAFSRWWARLWFGGQWVLPDTRLMDKPSTYEARLGSCWRAR